MHAERCEQGPDSLPLSLLLSFPGDAGISLSKRASPTPLPCTAHVCLSPCRSLWGEESQEEIPSPSIPCPKCREHGLSLRPQRAADANREHGSGAGTRLLVREGLQEMALRSSPGQAVCEKRGCAQGPGCEGRRAHYGMDISGAWEVGGQLCG